MTTAAATTSRFGTPQVLLGLSVAILVIVVAVPVLLIFFNAFWVDGHFNVADVIKVLQEQETYQALLNSLILASGVTVTGTIVGTFFAWLVTRTDLPFKGLMKVLFLVPFMLPSFIGALAWKMLLSPRAGYINRFFMDVLGFDGPVFDIYTYAGIILVETMYLFPFVFIQVGGALERMDPTLEESARISGADLFTITRKITIPLVLPSILSGALLIMLYSMAHFGTVAVLGIETGIYNIPTLIYEKIHQSAGSFDSIRTGTVLATVLVITAAFILWLQNRVLARGRYQIIAGKSFRPTEVKLRGLRMPMLIFCLAYIGFTIVLPTATIFMVGGLRTYGLPFTAENLTWENYRYILFEWDLTRDAIWNSISLGFTAAVITMFAGVIISYVIVKMKVRGKGLLEFLGMLPFSVPGFGDRAGRDPRLERQVRRSTSTTPSGSSWSPTSPATWRSRSRPTRRRWSRCTTRWSRPPARRARRCGRRCATSCCRWCGPGCWRRSSSSSCRRCASSPCRCCSTDRRPEPSASRSTR